MKWFVLLLVAVGCCLSASADTFYVSTNSLTDGPGTAWSNAFHTIQGAVDTAASNDTVWVTNGVYDTGARVTPSFACSNRLVITNEILVRSVNGPEWTIIKGAEATGGGKGSNAVRGVYMSAGVLSGFTITNGHTMDSGDDDFDQSGGGINMYGGSGVVTNCTLSRNWATYGGGGSYGTLFNCTLSSNWAFRGGGSYQNCVSNSTLSNNWAFYGGGSYWGELFNCTLSGNEASFEGGGSNGGTLTNCTLSGNSADDYGGGSCDGWLFNCTLSNNWAGNRGGGSYWGELFNCTLSGNSTWWQGGGSYGGALGNCTLSGNEALNGGGCHYGSLYNCTLSGNSATNLGGGSYEGRLDNCTLTDNSAGEDGGGSYSGTLDNCTLTDNSAGNDGGGSYDGTLNNCILYFNTAGERGNNWDDTVELFYSCTTPSPAGTGNITNNPQFVDAATSNFHLQVTSPCIDAGDNALMPLDTDLDGTPRPLDGDDDGTATVDMGCYEFLNVNADSDGDSMLDGWEEDHGLDLIIDDANDNPDGDSPDNRDEYTADTDPHDSNDYFHITAITNESFITVYFDSSDARLYTMKGCSNLIGGVWTPIPGAGPRMGVAGGDAMTDTNGVTRASIYQLKVELP